MEYIHFTEEQKVQARKTDLASLLRSRGERLKRSGSEQEWESDSGKVTLRGNLWFHQYEREGGDAIDFARRFFNLTFPEAVSFLLSEQGIQITEPEERQEEKKTFALPKANADMRRVYAYLLKGRFLDREIVDYFTRKKLIYEDAEYHNAVFVGRDEKGTPRHAHKRGTYSEGGYKGNVTGSIPEYSFHYIGNSSRLYVFEAPVDMLSYLSTHKKGWRENSYVALCSVAPQAVLHILKTNPQIDIIVTCLDHDKAGIEGNYRVTEEVCRTGEHYKVEVKQPEFKDWNECLKAEHGLEPIPASEHPGMMRMKELCAELAGEWDAEKCPKYPLQELQDLYGKIKSVAFAKSTKQNVIAEQSYEMSGVAFLFARKQFLAMEQKYTKDQYTKALFSLYPPHHDSVGYNSRLAEIGERLQNIQTTYEKNEILSGTEQRKLAMDTLSLSVDCLRLSMFAENQQERREVLCPVLQQSS